jgi:hypothetical protein
MNNLAMVNSMMFSLAVVPLMMFHGIGLHSIVALMCFIIGCVVHPSNQNDSRIIFTAVDWQPSAYCTSDYGQAQFPFPVKALTRGSSDGQTPPDHTSVEAAKERVAKTAHIDAAAEAAAATETEAAAVNAATKANALAEKAAVEAEAAAAKAVAAKARAATMAATMAMTASLKPYDMV